MSIDRRGFTIVELLVVIMVISLLAALILPGVQLARESSRRLSCANNLKQIGIALLAYESVSKSLPGGSYFSPHALMLPYLEQNGLYHSMNFGIIDNSDSDVVNKTVRGTRLAVFLCPSDGIDPLRQSGTNYAGNRGTGFNGSEHATNGLFVSNVAVTLGYDSIVDGAANTAAFGEWSLGRYGGPPDRLRSIFETSSFHLGPQNFEDFAKNCMSVNVSNSPLEARSKGDNWLSPGFGNSTYNHTLKINDFTCKNGSYTQLGAWTVGSQHPGGANVVFADGHVRFVREGVELSVWHALGTRNGGELYSSSDL